MCNAPGKSHRKGISLVELCEMFSTEEKAADWFESCRWPEGVNCPHCGSVSIARPKNERPARYRCRDCRQHFSIKTKTVMAESKLPLRKWAIAIYLSATNLKGVSSMKLHRDLNITQKSAWFLSHRIRDALENPGGMFSGPVEVDETYIGGKRGNMHAKKRREMREAHPGRGGVGKVAVVGVKDRATGKIVARPVDSTDGETLRGFAENSTEEGAQVYTDEARGYKGMARSHESVNHSIGEYVDGMVHTNGIESFWSMFKRGYHGTFHHVSPKHLARYLDEFSTRHGMRDADTADMMQEIAARMIGKRLTYSALTAEPA